MASVERGLQLEAAKIAGRDAAMDRAAAHIKANLMAEAARHNLTTAFMNSFSIVSRRGESPKAAGVLDRIVYTTDPGAMAINYGHTTKAGNRVPGKHVFEKAIGRTSG